MCVCVLVLCPEPFRKICVCMVRDVCVCHVGREVHGCVEGRERMCEEVEA